MTEIRRWLRTLDRKIARRKEQQQNRAELRHHIEEGLKRIRHPHREALVRAMDAGQDPDEVLRLIILGSRSGVTLRG